MGRIPLGYAPSDTPADRRHHDPNRPLNPSEPIGAIGSTRTPQILAPRDVQRAPTRSQTRWAPAEHQPRPDPSKGRHVRIRLHGTPTEMAAAIAALGQVLNIHTISRPYPDRPPSTLERIYIDADPRDPEDSR